MEETNTIDITIENPSLHPFMGSSANPIINDKIDKIFKLQFEDS